MCARARVCVSCCCSPQSFPANPSRRTGTAEETTGYGWFSDGLRSLAAGFTFEGDMSVDMETGAVGHSNGLYQLRTMYMEYVNEMYVQNLYV